MPTSEGKTMTTEKDKTIKSEGVALLNALTLAVDLPQKQRGLVIAGATEKHLTAVWEAARADAIEECAKQSHAIAKHIVDEEMPYIQRRLEKGLAADITGMVTIIDWHLRSLSRKQEAQK